MVLGESEETNDESIAQHCDSEWKIWTAPSQRLFLNTSQTNSAVQAKNTPRWKVKTSVTLGQRKEELRSISWLIALLRLPYPLSCYAICVTAQASFPRLAWPSVFCSISARKILPTGSIFLKVCAAGKLNAVRRLALEGLGLPSSIDEAGTPALHVCNNLHAALILANLDSMRSAVALLNWSAFYWTMGQHLMT